MNAVYVLIGLSILGVILWGVWLAKQFWLRPTEWANFVIAAWSAVFATLIFGLIVGLSLYYVQHTQESEEHTAQQVKQAAENRSRILALTKTELEYNQQTLHARIADATQAADHIRTAPLKNEFWKMLSASGDVRWISNYELLYKISNAYFRLENTMYWEHQFLEAATSTGIAMMVTMSNGTSMPLVAYVWSLTAPTYPEAEKAVTVALEGINQESHQH
jgi:hypothetical protein